MLDILHFCGYWNEPTENDARHLLDELKTDKTFGLTEIAQRLVIMPCPEYLLNEFIQEEDE